MLQWARCARLHINCSHRRGGMCDIGGNRRWCMHTNKLCSSSITPKLTTPIFSCTSLITTVCLVLFQAGGLTLVVRPISTGSTTSKAKTQIASMGSSGTTGKARATRWSPPQWWSDRWISRVHVELCFSLTDHPYTANSVEQVNYWKKESKALNKVFFLCRWKDLIFYLCL